MKNKSTILTISITSIIIALLFILILPLPNFIKKPNKSVISYDSFTSKSNRNKYYLNVTLNEEEKSLSCFQILSMKNKYNCDLNELVFHLYADSYNSSKTMPSIGFRNRSDLSPKELGDIIISSVKINDKKVDFSQEDQILKVYPVQSIKKNASVDVLIDFSLKIPNGTDRLGYVSNQYSLTNWYPILSIYDENSSSWDENPFYPIGESNFSECSDYWLELTTPSNTVSVSTGIKVKEMQNKKLKSTTFAASNVRDFALFMSKDYKVISANVNNITVNSYYLNDSTKDTAKRMLSLASEALKFFSDKFGDYPYEEFDIVESFLSGGAMEYPTIIQMGPYPILSSEIDPSQLSFFDEAVVHEVAHQWWYSTVGNNSFTEPILDESFTSFSTCYFFDKVYGEYNPKGIKGSLLCNNYYIENSFFPIYRRVDEMNWYNWGIVVYKLGAIAIEDFHQRVGEEKFLQTFQTYYEEFKFKNATFNDFLDITENVCGKDVSDHLRNSFTSKSYNYKLLLLDENERSKIK